MRARRPLQRADRSHRDGSLVELRPREMRPPPDERERAYRRFVLRARRGGYLIGWARHRYRERFGAWPRGLDHLESLRIGNEDR